MSVSWDKILSGCTIAGKWAEGTLSEDPMLNICSGQDNRFGAKCWTHTHTQAHTRRQQDRYLDTQILRYLDTGMLRYLSAFIRSVVNESRGSMSGPSSLPAPVICLVACLTVVAVASCCCCELLLLLLLAGTIVVIFLNATTRCSPRYWSYFNMPAHRPAQRF